jgi:hypothetical protein
MLAVKNVAKRYGSIIFPNLETEIIGLVRNVIGEKIGKRNSKS